MEKPPAFENFEKGKNVSIDIELIRHPEKSHETGDLTDSGREDFLNKLKEDHRDDYDLVKFYISPLKRGQQSGQSAQEYLNDFGINSKIRTRKQLVPEFEGFSQESMEEVAKLISKEEEIDKKRPAYEPPSKDFETKANELLIQKYFDENFPLADFSGEDIGSELNNFIEHFSKMTEKLKSGSKAKLVLVSHSGIIEHFIKYIYLKNNPDKDPKSVSAEEIGGLVDFMDGPKIEIKTDEGGHRSVKIYYKDMDLEIK